MSVFGGTLENDVYLKTYNYYAATEEVLPGAVFVRRDRESHDIGVGDGLRVRFFEWLYARATYEYATRLPDPEEVFGDGNLIIPNLGLVPERSHNATLEVVLDHDDLPIGDLSASVSGFARARQNMIVLLGNDRVFSYQNVYEALTLGVEGTLTWTSPEDWVMLEANATYLDDRNASTQGTFADFEGDRIPNRPYLIANFAAEARAHDVLDRGDRLALGWRSRYVHEFFRGWESQGLREFKQIVPSQFAQDVGISYTVDGPPSVTTSIEITNLGDDDLFDFFGVQRPGRAGWIKLTVEL